MSVIGIAKDIKLSHSIFALPFMVAGVIIADVEQPTVRQMGLLVLAMIAARTFAMCSNRIFDRDIDQKNARTAQRALPSGHVSLKSYVSCLVVSGFVLAFAAFSLKLYRWMV